MKTRYQINASVDFETVRAFDALAHYWGVKPGGLASQILPRFRSVPPEKLNTVLNAIDEAVMKITQRNLTRKTRRRTAKRTQ